jgi:hypothetical protein
MSQKGILAHTDDFVPRSDACGAQGTFCLGFDMSRIGVVSQCFTEVVPACHSEQTPDYPKKPLINSYRQGSDIGDARAGDTKSEVTGPTCIG